MVDFDSVSATMVIDTFLLLLIGIGPKIALVPFLDTTAGMPPATRARVARKMVTTAGFAAAALLVLGGVLTRLLHFSPAALGVSSGIILFVIAVPMVLAPHDTDGDRDALAGRDPMQLAIHPLAIPYLLNPAGIVVLVTASAEAGSLGVYGVVIGTLALVIALDFVVFRWANRLGEHLDENRMLVVEKVFGFLLAALAVQIGLDGLADLGVIHLTAH